MPTSEYLLCGDGYRLWLHWPRVCAGSGVDYDLRRDGEERYTEMYDGYAFEVIVAKVTVTIPKDHDYPAVPPDAVLGDCWHRFYVRMLEVMQSIDHSCVRRLIKYSHRERRLGNPYQADDKITKGRSLFGNGSATRTDGFLSSSVTARRFRGEFGRGAVAFPIFPCAMNCAVAYRSPTFRLSLDRSISLWVKSIDKSLAALRKIAPPGPMRQMDFVPYFTIFKTHAELAKSDDQ